MDHSMNDLIYYFTVLLVIEELPSDLSIIRRNKHFTYNKRVEIASALVSKCQLRCSQEQRTTHRHLHKASDKHQIHRDISKVHIPT